MSDAALVLHGLPVGAEEATPAGERESRRQRGLPPAVEPGARGGSRVGDFLLYTLLGAMLFIVASPLVVVVLGSFLNTAFLGLSSEQWIAGGGESLVTFKWFAYVFDLYRPQLLFSMRIAVGAVLGCLLLGVPGGLLLARGRFPGRALLEELVMMPLALPGIAVSIALIQAYSAIRGSAWLVLGGHLLYTLPFMVRGIAHGARSSALELQERAARSLGANRWQVFRFVTLPGLRHTAMLNALLVFAVSFGEFNVSFLLTTPLTATFPSALYATYTFNSFQVSSAATVIFLAVVLPVLTIIQRIGGDGPAARLEQGA